MATTPPKKGAGKKAKQRRIYLALGLVALAVVGYLWYRNRSGGASLAASPSGANAGTGATDSGSAGGLSGSPLDQSGQDLSGLLGALQGENQDLLNGFISNQGRLVTPFGGVATATDQTPLGPVGPGPEIPAALPQAASPNVVSTNSQAQPLTAAAQASFGTYPEINFTPPTPTSQVGEGGGGPAIITPQSGPSVGGYVGEPIIKFTAPTPELSYPVSSASGAAGVKSGATKVNYQAKARAT